MNISEAIKHLNEKKKDFESIREKAEYIEKAELIKKLCLETAVGYCSPTIKTIKEFPVADIQPVKRGRWENTNTPNQLRCSKCEVIHFIAQYPHGEINFCPNCGARMDLKDGDEE